MSYTTDDKGNKSSMRLFLTVMLTPYSLMLLTWTYVFLMEAVTKENPDYEGLSLIITAILGGGIFSLAAKVIQKKYETKKYETKKKKQNENDSIE